METHYKLNKSEYKTAIKAINIEEYKEAIKELNLGGKEMKIHELQELTGLSLSDLAKKTGISYNRVLKLNKGNAKYTMKDYELIGKYVKNIGKNVIQIDFTQIADKRVPFNWERRREIDFIEYKKAKESKRRAENKEKASQKRVEMFRELRGQQ